MNNDKIRTYPQHIKDDIVGYRPKKRRKREENMTKCAKLLQKHKEQRAWEND